MATDCRTVNDRRRRVTVRENINSDDPYEILGLPEDCTKERIHIHYKILARKYHPDSNPTDASAESKFIKVKETYEWLNKNHIEPSEATNVSLEDVLVDEDVYLGECEKCAKRFKCTDVTKEAVTYYDFSKLGNSTKTE